MYTLRIINFKITYTRFKKNTYYIIYYVYIIIYYNIYKTKQIKQCFKLQLQVQVSCVKTQSSGNAIFVYNI